MNSRLSYLREKTSNLTLSPGVYLMKDSKNEIIYIGKAKKLRNRVSSYFRENAEHNPKVQAMVNKVYDYDFIVTDSEFEALVLECSLIKQHKPRYNILLKDDKGYHYIHITDEEYPRIKCNTNTKAGGRYIGPYMSGTVVTETVNEVNKVFKLPTCSKQFPRDFCKQRPCLNFYIKNCMGVCAGNIDKEYYNKVINDAIEYIKSGSKNSIQALTAEMNQAAERLEFEKAAVLRDRIRAIQKSAEQQKIIINSSGSLDVIGDIAYNNGVCITVIKYRESKLYDKVTFDIKSADTDVLEQFLVQFYNKVEAVPEKIVVNKISESNAQLIEKFIRHRVLNNSRNIILRGATSEQEIKIVNLALNNSREQALLKLKSENSTDAVLLQLKSILGLNKIPEYIEAYDISNLGNQNIVAGQIVFEHGKPLRQAYRKYTLSSQMTQNDYKSMYDTIEKRIKRLLDSPSHSNWEDTNNWDKYNRHKPDLILLDGGKQHVATIKKLLLKYNLDIPVFGMIKNDKHKTKSLTNGSEEIDINNITNSAVFRLIEQIQNEVHKYTVEFMHKTYNKNTYRSELEQIKGIGEKKAQALLRHFKTIDGLRSASIEQLTQVSGISTELARQIYLYLH